MSRSIGWIFILAGTTFLLIGLCLCFGQYRSMQGWVKTQARVLEASIEEIDGSKGVTYKPCIKYRYCIGKHIYTSKRVTPLDESGNYGFASRIVDKFEPGRKYPAYYDPNDPGSSFILHEYSFFPYFFVCLSPIFALMGLSTVFFSSDDLPKAPRPLSSGLYELKSPVSMRRSMVGHFVSLTVWILTNGSALYHYFVVTHSRLDALSIAAIVLFAVVLVPLLVALVRNLLLQINMCEARVFLNAPCAKAGHELTVQIEQKFLRTFSIDEFLVGLSCTTTTKNVEGNKERYETSSQDIVFNKAKSRFSQAAGSTLRQSVKLEIPSDLRASTTGQEHYPRRVYNISMRLIIAGAPDYLQEFPIVLERA